jgi:hypothetical protein
MTIDPRLTAPRVTPPAATRATPAEAPLSAVGRAYGLSPATQAPRAAPARPAQIDRLVAGVVPGKATFGSAQAPDQAARTPSSSQTGSLAFYRRPTDKNEVATVLSLGRGLDVTG